MQSRIEHLLAELKLSKPLQHHKKGKQTLAEHFTREVVELDCPCCGEQRCVSVQLSSTLT